MKGKKLFTYALKGGQNTLLIKEESIKQGVYFYKAILNDKIIATDKIVIVK